jgi:hypothetical protein
VRLPNHDGILHGEINFDKASIGMSITVEEMLNQIAASKACVSNIADNELMLWSEESIADALRYAADCVARIDAMPDTEDEE